MADCIFCKIIHGQTNGEEIIFENDDCIVILDRYRITSVGAICLVIPKKHVQDITFLDDSIASILMLTIKDATVLSKTTFGAKGVRIWQANGHTAGQSIGHLHFHIVPCNSVMDRIIAQFPISFDIFRRHNIFLKNRQINKSKLSLYAERLRNNYNSRRDNG